MSEIKVNWDDNAKEAVRCYAKEMDDFDSTVDKFLDKVSTWPTRKTVEDAVRAVLTGFDGQTLYYSPSRKTWYGSGGPIPQDSYKVCTRDEFEECVRGKDEWTHTYGDRPCKITGGPNKNGHCFVEFSSTLWDCLHIDTLKPIKPTITKAAMDAVESFAYSLLDKESYDIPAEVAAFRNSHEVTE